MLRYPTLDVELVLEVLHKCNNFSSAYTVIYIVIFIVIFLCFNKHCGLNHTMHCVVVSIVDS